MRLAALGDGGYIPEGGDGGGVNRVHDELFRPRITKEGGERMSDYELLMIFLTVLSLVTALITKDRK